MRLRIISIISLLLFIALSIFVYIQRSYFPIDLVVTQTVQQFHPIWFDTLMKFLTDIGYVSTASILIVAVSLFLLALGKLEAMLVFVGSSYGSVYLAEIIKDVITRPRPDPTLILQLGQYDRADSFPSGHVLFAIGLYGFLAYLCSTDLKKPYAKIGAVLCGLVILLMGVSRIYLGGHWFTDVLGSYLIGTIWLYAAVYIYQRIKPKLKTQDL
jgi:undecaprenyl-diphosphatase